MRVGVIRGDVPSPIFLADLEPTSQFNPPTEPVGQTRYVSRPNPTAITNYLAGVYASDTQDGAPAVTIPIPSGQTGAGGVPAGVQSTSAITFPVVITGANHIFEFRNASAASFTSVTIPSGSYATMAALVTAVNSVVVPTGLAKAVADASGTLLVIQSSVPGVGSYIEIDANPPSTFNAAANFSGGGQIFTMPTAATIIAALNPVVIPPATGSIDVSAATLLTTLGAAPAAASVANLIAPQFVETEVAVQSYQVGDLAKYLELTWNPNPRLLPAITSGPAIQVVEDDGHTNFSSSTLAPLPKITGAVHNSPNTGDITITGVGLGNVEFQDATVVIVRAAASTLTNGSGVPFVRLTQKQINHTLTGGTQGSVSNTTIVIPASLLIPVGGTGLGVVGSTVEVKYVTFGNTNYGSAATISAWAANVSTLTGLTGQQTSQIGQYIVVSGAASPGNNGTFQILSRVSATSITIANVFGVAGDANNGSIVWSEPVPVAFPVT